MKRTAERNGSPPPKASCGERADSHKDSDSIHTTATRTTHDLPNERKAGPSRSVWERELERGASGMWLQHFTAGLTGPHLNHPAIPVELNLSMLDDIASVVRSAIISDLYPCEDGAARRVINDLDWCLVIRLFLKSRIDHVYSAYTGKRPLDRTPLMRSNLPRSLAVLINGIGLTQVLWGIDVFPTPPRPVEDPSQNLRNLVSYSVITEFEKLVMSATQRGIIHAGQLSSMIEGSKWWLLGAFDTHSEMLANIESSVISVRGQMGGWSPIDGFHAAMAVTGFKGSFIDEWKALSMDLDPISNAVATRVVFALEG